MKALRSYSLIVLLTALMIGEVCCAAPGSQQREGALSGNSTVTGGSASPHPESASAKDYTAPDNSFALKIPGGWKLQREEKDGAYITVIRPGQYGAVNLAIMTIKATGSSSAPAELKSHLLVESSKPFFQGWIDGLKEQTRVEGTGDIYPTRFAGFDALRMDVTYYRNDGDDPRRGYSLYLRGDTTIFFISATGSQSRFKELEEIIATIHLEP